MPAGWDQTGATCSDGSSPANIDVSAGETVTCTFKNRKRGRIIAVKDTQPDDGQDFSFTAGGGLTPTSFQLDDDGADWIDLSNTQVFDDLVPQSGYTLAESSVPAGWDLASASCNDGSPLTNINVSAGETVTCTFTNKKRGTIVIQKDAFPDETDDFTFQKQLRSDPGCTRLSPASFQLDDDPTNATLPNTRTFSNVVAKSGYTVTEDPTIDFAIGVRCDDGASATPSTGNLPARGATINVDPGETVTCTYVNTGVYPRPGGGTPYRVPLVPAFKACTAPNRTHVAPLNNPSCAPWALESSQLRPPRSARARASFASTPCAATSACPATRPTSRSRSTSPTSARPMTPTTRAS